MKKVLWLFTFLCTSIFATPLFSEEHITKANGIEICYETFGDHEDPALLLIMGACCQGIIWPDDLCTKFAEEGFYVIRYDHRDAGLSTCFDFESCPYDLLDMAKDGIGLLDALGIKKAHLLGLSMGGPIAEIMSVYFPERISTITLMATSSDFRPLNLACAGQEKEKNSLSAPTEKYLQFMENFLKFPAKDFEGKLAQRIAFWHFLNGSIFPLEEEQLRYLHHRFLSRMKYEKGLANHMHATLKSEKIIQEVPYKVTIPTLIIHGSEDPIFPQDHGESLGQIISNSKYVFLKGLGHVPNPHFYDVLIHEFKMLVDQCKN